MDFGFSDEQELLRGQARDLLDRESPTRRVRELLDGAAGYDPGLHARIAGLGWTGIPFPADNGGQGLGMVELALVLEEMGRHLVPSPLQSTVGLAGMVVLAGGTAEQRARLLPGICDGSALASLAHAPLRGRWDPATAVATAGRSGDGYRVSAPSLIVPDAHVANWMIVPARDGDGITLLVVATGSPGVSVAPVPVLDLTRRVSAVRLDAVEVGADSIVGVPQAGAVPLGLGLERALVAVSAELCGTAQRAMELAVEHARSRVQFGQPIGAFQAVSHRCADMLVRVEQARSLLYHAAWALDAGRPDAGLAASMAKAYAGETARVVTAGALQVHGGLGFTWEHDAHLHFRRAAWGETVLGDTSHHRERVAELLAL